MHRVETLIQHHPSRAAQAKRLVAAIGAGTIIPDPDPDGMRSAWRTYRACLTHPVDASHVCVIQDDSWPMVERLADLLPRLAAADRLSSLFCAAVPVRAARAVHQASDAGECWAEMPRGEWVPAIALIWPRHLAERFVAWVDATPTKRLQADDGLIGKWLQNDTSVPQARCSVPNLVQHPDDVPSISSHTRRQPAAGSNLRRVSTCEPLPGCDLHAVPWDA